MACHASRAGHAGGPDPDPLATNADRRLRPPVGRGGTQSGSWWRRGARADFAWQRRAADRLRSVSGTRAAAIPHFLAGGAISLRSLPGFRWLAIFNEASVSFRLALGIRGRLGEFTDLQ